MLNGYACGQDHGSKMSFIAGCVVAFAVLFYWVFSFYRMKNRW